MECGALELLPICYNGISFRFADKVVIKSLYLKKISV